MIKIPLGDFKGLKLDYDAKHTRPTDQKTVLSIFSSLLSKREIAESTVLDLFAGSGILGLTALSLGAKRITLVDQNKIKLPSKLDQDSRISQINTRVESFLMNTPDKYQIIFIDPPYKYQQTALINLVNLSKTLIEYNGIVILRTANFSKDPLLFEEFIKTSSLEVNLLNYRIFNHTIVWYFNLINLNVAVVEW